MALELVARLAGRVKILSMTWRDTALGLAGVIGSTVAVVHGIRIQRLVVRLDAILLADKGMTAPVRRLVPGLLHFSTVTWFLGGLALIAAALWFEKNARLATGLVVGSLYLYGALGNLWVTRGLQRIKAAGEKDWRAHAEWLRLTFPADYRGSGHKVEVQQAVQVQISQERLADIRSRLEHTRAALSAGGRSDTDVTVLASRS